MSAPGRAALELRNLVIRAQNVMRRRLRLEVHRYFPPPPPCNILATVLSDVLLRRVLAGQGTDLTFLQIGANDGVTFDPIHAFITRYGFRGVCVEPQPDIFARLQATYRDRPEITCVHAAVAASDGTATMYRFKAGPGVPADAHGLASFSREAVLGNLQGYTGEVEALEVPAISIPTLLAQLDAPDFVQIDAEGFDFEIVKLLLPHCRPTVLHFEAQFLLPSERHDCYAFLVAHGYTVTPNGSDAVAYLEPAAQAVVTVTPTLAAYLPPRLQRR